MDKLENVIKGLEEVQHYIKVENLPAHTLKAKLVIDDAIALLKAQVEEIKALRQLVEWAEECGFGLDNILWREYVTEEELDSIDGYVEQMIYVARKAVNGNA